MHEQNTCGLPQEQPLTAAKRLLDEAKRFAEQVEQLRLEITTEPGGTIESEAA